MGSKCVLRIHELQLRAVINNANTMLVQQCSSCAYKGDEDTFPPKKYGIGYTRTCLRCTTNKALKRVAKGKEKENIDPSVARDNATRKPTTTPGLQPSILSLEDCLKLLAISKDSPFELDAFVTIPEGMFEGKDMHGFSNRLRDQLAEASDYRWK
jgi:hypothetical protein